jgi:hypothetical protein
MSTIVDFFQELNKAWDKEPELLIELGITDEVFMNAERAYAKERLEYLRGELRAESISYGELAELQSLAEHIDEGDVELLEVAGVPEIGEMYKEGYFIQFLEDGQWQSVFPEPQSHLSQVHPSLIDARDYMKNECGVEEFISVEP